MTARQVRLGVAIWIIALTVSACPGTPTPTSPDSPMPPMADTPPAPPPPMPPPPPPPVSATARYQVTFDALWSSTTHPSDFPDDAHFSPLIGGTHTAAVAFWQDGGLATLGIQLMAETGSQAPLDDEIETAIDTGRAQHILRGPGLSDSPGAATMEFTISQDFPRVTLVTMIAPSPDWFVGVSGLLLFDAGSWRDDVRLDLAPWDAGTDGGTTFKAEDLDLNPHRPIARITGFPFAHDGQVAPVGTFTFRRIQ